MMDNRYILYRNLYDIFHPTISRKNIENYDIVIDNQLASVKVFYPSINVDINKIIIYIPDRITKKKAYDLLAKKTNHLLLVINYKEDEKIDSCYKLIRYIYSHIQKLDIKSIAIMSDYRGTNIEQEILKLSIKRKEFNITKSIFLEPNKTYSKEKNLLKNSLVIYDLEKQNSNTHIIELKEFINGNHNKKNEYLYQMINDYIN